MDYDKIAPMMRRLWAPIAIVTASSQGRDNAQAAVSIGGASIVADRPRVVVQLYKTNLTHDLVVESGAFALCFARRDQLDLVHDTGFVSGHKPATRWRAWPTPRVRPAARCSTIASASSIAASSTPWTAAT